MVKHEFEQPISITDICSGLDLQFSGYSRGPAAYNTNSDLIYLSGEERLTIIMDGFGPDTEGVNRKALNLIRNGLNRIKAGDVEKVRKEMGEVLFKSSNTLARRLKGVGGLSVVAVKYVSTPYLRTAVFGWLGKARLYSDDRGIYQPLTIDDTYELAYEDREEARGAMWALDYTKDPEKLEPLSRIRQIWNESPSMPPYRYLGKANLDSVYVNLAPIFPGTKLLLATIGLYRNLTAREIRNILRTESDPAKSLVEFAWERSQNPANKRANRNTDISTIVVEEKTIGTGARR
ncbi:hypothetical protein A3D83_00930 [Candidatus Daviesbacteria bacterium RIFCSPHIGHO2_02_FULL_41_10]|uniref:PPM-type phosphatase domain-containing protein n=1 Tax=Candidatus Daviesbacteria bacterium RIFCSPHIGHO2_02_FULL_41_10 TaxID=1797774 RepID=A0A1F5JXZ4_9BACT|nr:MAG: hypothetical protein A3D83_00930 [Candidatus Daviesbacteria bacterium RIFCSPHIGHO2_02_FULL_41_10]